ncbi:MAG: radical SAM protein [Nitrospirota bacterium]
MKKILFFTLYDVICIGTRILSSIAKKSNIETHIVLFKDQKARPVFKDSTDYLTYQFYTNGIKHGSCYAAYPYTKKEVSLFYDIVSEVKPDLVCLSTRTFAYKSCKEIFCGFKKIFDIPVIGGGWGPTLEPAKFLEFCDYVCFGEGERTMDNICINLNDNILRDFTNVSNLLYYKSGNLKKNPVAEPLSSKEMDELPLPDYDYENKYLIENNKIKTAEEFYNEKVYNCFAGRGCPMTCTYCLSNKYKQMYAEHDHTIKKYRMRSVDVVIDELEQAKDKGAKFIRIADEVFPVDKNWTEEFIIKYKDKINLPYFAYVRPEYHNTDVLNRMANIGFTSSVVGIQSGSHDIRKNIFKRYLSETKLIQFAYCLKELNVEYTYNLINYNPYEKEVNMEEALNLLQKLPFSPITLFKLAVFPGSLILTMIERDKPVAEPDNIQKWYGYLYTMVTAGKTYRKIAGFIKENNLFKTVNFPFHVLLLPLYFGYIKEKILKKIRYGAPMMIKMPKKNRKNKT